jgi:hypothetical protein
MIQLQGAIQALLLQQKGWPMGFIGRASKSTFDNTSENALFPNKTNLKTHALLGYYNPSLYLQLLSLILV